MESMNSAAREKLREQHRPRQMRVLFVGESPPSGGTFFYSRNSHLYHRTAMAFSRAEGAGYDESQFLDHFRSIGCYLDDLCLEPIDGLSKPKRREACARGITSLAARLAHYSPRCVIYTPLSIEPHIQKAYLASGIHVPIHGLPFPAHGHQNKYVEALATLLKDLRNDGTLIAASRMG